MSHKISHEININTFKSYEPADYLIESDKQILKSYDFTKWCLKIPDSLKMLCIKRIAFIWKDYPIDLNILEHSDRSQILDYLPVDILLELSIPKLHDDCYWEKKYIFTWPRASKSKKFLPNYISYKQNNYENKSSEYSLNSKKKSEGNESEEDFSLISISPVLSVLENFQEKPWKQRYIERYLEESLEVLKPEKYENDVIKQLVSLCKNYVISLSLNEMQAPDKASGNIEHIPLNIVLSGLPFLTELSICFQQKYLKKNFSWDAFKVSLQDISLLSKGLEKCDLYSFRIVNSDIDCIKIELLFDSLLKNEKLRSLDLSHCEVGDKGVLTICKLVQKHRSLNKIVLTNNKIGYAGAKYFATLLCRENCKLSCLNLRLNSIGVEGGKYLMESLKKGGKSLRELSLAGCCLKNSNKSIGKMIAINNSLEYLDISSNKIGEDVGLFILEGMKRNATITYLDLRLCGLTSNTEKAILDETNKNKKGQMESKIFKLELDDDDDNIKLDDFDVLND